MMLSFFTKKVTHDIRFFHNQVCLWAKMLLAFERDLRFRMILTLAGLRSFDVLTD